MSGPQASGHIAPIDGLRALAVLSVVIFHLNETWLPGGFIGVDVFFVISGFVVTASLLERRFASLVDLMSYFYARRLVRIMPALIVMLLVTTIAYVLFIPEAWLSQSIPKLAQAAFLGLSNVQLIWDYDTYFNPQSGYNPFVHTWSLGVEEQFYLVFPFLLYLHLKQSNGKFDRLTIWGITLCGAASVAVCAALTAHYWRYAFYSIPARFWELAAGMLLRLTADKWVVVLVAAERRVASGFAWSSTGLIAVSLALPVSEYFPFPQAILPVAGATGLIACFATRSDGRLRAAFSAAPVVLIGRMSYSIYLWHWPVFVLFRWTVGLQGALHGAIALVCVAALASASYWLVETPFRHGVAALRLPRNMVIIGALGSVGLAYAGAAALLDAKPALSLSRTAEAGVWAPGDASIRIEKPSPCSVFRSYERVSNGGVLIFHPSGCRLGSNVPRLVVIGDSHSLVYRPILSHFAAQHGVEVHSYFRAGCPFLPLDRPSSKIEDCRTFENAAVARILTNARTGDMLFLPSLRLRRFADQWGGDAAKEDDRADFTSDRSAAGAEALALVTSFEERGLSVVFEAPTPIFRSPAFRCSDWFNASNPVCKGGLTITRSEFDRLRSPAMDVMQTIVTRRPQTAIWDPSLILCPGEVCSAVTPVGPIFFDGDHLSGYANDVLYSDFSRLALSHLRSTVD